MAREYSRTQRVSQLLKEEISYLLLREVKDVRIGTVTVTGVETTSDLKHAKVYVQISGEVDRQDEAMDGLRSAAGFIRSRIGRELKIRRAPELHFVLDRTHERASRISELLAEIEPEEASDGGDGQE